MSSSLDFENKGKGEDHADRCCHHCCGYHCCVCNFCHHLGLGEFLYAKCPAAAWQYGSGHLADSGGPVDPVIPLNAWEKYAQVLLMANEAVFVD